jgi:hypothetical protein
VLRRPIETARETGNLGTGSRNSKTHSGEQETGAQAGYNDVETKVSMLLFLPNPWSSSNSKCIA